MEPNGQTYADAAKRQLRELDDEPVPPRAQHADIARWSQEQRVRLAVAQATLAVFEEVKALRAEFAATTRP